MCKALTTDQKVPRSSRGGCSVYQGLRAMALRYAKKSMLTAPAFYGSQFSVGSPLASFHPARPYAQPGKFKIKTGFLAIQKQYESSPRTPLRRAVRGLGAHSPHQTGQVFLPEFDANAPGTFSGLEREVVNRTAFFEQSFESKIKGDLIPESAAEGIHTHPRAAAILWRTPRRFSARGNANVVSQTNPSPSRWAATSAMREPT